jgi:hypothetical protein
LAKPLKIEKHRLQSVVAQGIHDGKNAQEIADECTRIAKQPISNMAVRRYIDSLGADPAAAIIEPASRSVPMERKREVISKDDRRVAKLVDRDIDLIDLQFQTTKALADRFEWIASLPDNFEGRIKQLRELLLQEDVDTTTLDHWGLGFTLELRRNIGNMAALNREIRQNSQFMATLREKAFEFNLITEYLDGFFEEFRQVNPEAYEVASERIALNPRMQRIIEQVQRVGGGEDA